MLTYAFADIHGRHDLLISAFAVIARDVALHGSVPYRVVSLGDYVDRGPKSSDVISSLMRVMGNRNPGFDMVCLQGNHEAMMIETITKPLHPDWWIGNGGGQTLLSYGHPNSGVYNPSVVPAEHLEWMAGLPLHFADGERIFVHAGFDHARPLDRQTDETQQWKLYSKRHDDWDMPFHGLHVIHGHHMQETGEPLLLQGRTNLDTAALYTNRLAIGVFEDGTPGPVNILYAEGD